MYFVNISSPPDPINGCLNSSKIGSVLPTYKGGIIPAKPVKQQSSTIKNRRAIKVFTIFLWGLVKNKLIVDILKIYIKLYIVRLSSANNSIRKKDQSVLLD